MDESSLHLQRHTLRFLAQTTDTNVFGNIHGGAVMKWIDEAAYVCAAGWCQRDCVTVYVGGIRFYQPVHVGDLVEVQSRLIHTGNTSMHIAVDVLAGSPVSTARRHATHCITVFVALDEHGAPTAVSKWQPQTAEDQKMEQYALRLMELRKGIEAEMQQHMEDRV